MKKILEKKSDCSGYYACFNACPVAAIKMESDEKGFKYPVINREKCIDCGVCKKACPVLAKNENHNEIKAYAAYNKNMKERLQSSSGGIFILLAKKIIEKGGVVFGAAFDYNYRVYHKCVDNIRDLTDLMGSKYVQSDINEAYRQAKEKLEEGLYVFFTGTPCQVEGLKVFLAKDYDKLYTQDIICHGVPSPKVWDKYLEFRRKSDREYPEKIFFRNKDKGWTNYHIKFEYKEKPYFKDKADDLFFKAFLKNTSLRDSCYECHFKKEKRVSDITLADYWGVKGIHPEMSDNKGTSFIVLNNQKGIQLFDSIKADLLYKETDFQYAVKCNKSMVKSSYIDPNREKFFENLEKIEFDELVEKYTKKEDIKKFFIRKIKNIIKKIVFKY